MADFYNPEVQQIFPDSCAIKSQQLILNDFGIEVSEVDLVQTAAVNGWYNGGTAPQDVGNLLELANIPVTRQEGANVFNLVNDLNTDNLFNQLTRERIRSRKNPKAHLRIFIF